VRPGAISVIPARAVAAIDIRAIDPDAIAAVENALDVAAGDVAARREVRVDRRLLRGGEPIALDERLAQAALDAAARRGLAAVRTHSGAGHDAGHMAALVPAALLFVPLAGGQSHTPHEDAEPADVLDTGRVLVDLLRTA
jgi:N-carbamoyl-L-amino-acid hydrolase